MDNFQSLDSVLSFDVDNKPAFEIPLKDVSAATTGKRSFILTHHSFSLDNEIIERIKSIIM